jgi:hypothetical protein
MQETIIILTSTLPPEASPILAVVLARSGLVYRDPADYLRRCDTELLRLMEVQIAQRDFDMVWALNCLEAELGLSPQEWTPYPSWWVTEILPVIRDIVERRQRPAVVNGQGPVAKLKALDLVEVVGRYTRLQRCGPGKFKGRCPMHNEKRHCGRRLGSDPDRAHSPRQNWCLFTSCSGQNEHQPRS